MTCKSIIKIVDKSLNYLFLKTKYIDDYKAVVSRVSNNFIKIACGEAIAHEDKITFYELKQLMMLVKLNNRLKSLNEKTVLTGKVEYLFNISNQAVQLLDDINDNLGIEVSDILVYDFNRQFFFRNTPQDIEEKLTQLLVSKYSHSAQVYEDSEGKKKLTHVWWDKYQTDNLTIREVSYSDIYRIDPTKLILGKIKDLWEAKYPKKDFVVSIRRQFHDIHNKLHRESQEDFKKISNTVFKRFKAGFADIGLFGGHKTWFKQERKSFIKNLDKEMTCSEFVAHSILGTMIALNQALQADLGIEERALELPFCDRERIDRIHPERLIKLCVAKGFIHKVQPSLKAQMFISHNLRQQKHYHTAIQKLKHAKEPLLLHKKKEVICKLRREILGAV